MPGVFVAGDVRADSVKRVASAVGEGAMAVTLAHRFLGRRDDIDAWTSTRGVRLPADELWHLFLFESLTDDQLDWIAAHGWVSALPAGSVVFAEGEPADVLVLLLGGTVSMTQRVGRDDVEINRTSHVGVVRRARCARSRRATTRSRSTR